MNIHFLKQRNKSDGYSTSIIYKRQKWETYCRDLLSDSLESLSLAPGGEHHMKQYVCTKVHGGFLRRCKHVLTLDCDSYRDMRLATGYLFTERISHTVIESSPGKYWVVTDKVGRFKELHNFMSTIPGVDREYVSFAYSRKAFNLRAFPRRGYIPRRVGNWDHGRESTLGSQGYQSEKHLKYTQWINEFMMYWGSNLMVDVSTNILRKIEEENHPLFREEDREEVGNLRMRHEIDGSRSWQRVIQEVVGENIVVSNEEAIAKAEVEEPLIEINNCLDLMEI